MDEKTIDLSKNMEEISKLINENYPFNISITIDKEHPYNGFVITVDKNVYKKYKAKILGEISEYYVKNFKINVNLTEAKTNSPMLRKDMSIYYRISI